MEASAVITLSETGRTDISALLDWKKRATSLANE
jgi:hypothetical protein